MRDKNKDSVHNIKWLRFHGEIPCQKCNPKNRKILLKIIV